jgi:hypothetical protein
MLVERAEEEFRIPSQPRRRVTGAEWREKKSLNCKPFPSTFVVVCVVIAGPIVTKTETQRGQAHAHCRRTRIHALVLGNEPHALSKNGLAEMTLRRSMGGRVVSVCASARVGKRKAKRAQRIDRFVKRIRFSMSKA